MRSFFTFCLLATLKVLCQLFFRYDLDWVGEFPEKNRWGGLRVAAVLHHTSLYEFLWVSAPPFRFLWQVAWHGVVPVADSTLARSGVGTFYKTVARHVVPISRERDHTWREVLQKIGDPRSVVVILPEGRMMRRNGLDKHGKPMTVRGGIADLLLGVDEGRLLLAYSRGLHHVQAPGERFPRLFRTLSMRFESIDIPSYRERLLAEVGEKGFKRAVIEDLEARRDHYCFPDPEERERIFAARAAARAAER
ncbi:MAG TPA: hypothetical protein PK413_19380 [Thermoanaerobaculia bacterium]|nr:hypothetical protein [Thermoanaerobaculia bacterium]